MPSFCISEIKNFDKLIFSNKLYLWVLHADKIPPHIAISLNERYFSIKINGKDDLNVKSILTLISKKSIPTILVELDLYNKVENNFEKVIEKYPFVNSKITCIVPVIELLMDKISDLILPDLLNILNNEKKIISYYGSNLKSYNNYFLSYSSNDVNERVENLLKNL